MRSPRFSVLIAALAVPSAAVDAQDRPARSRTVTQSVIIQQRMIIRVPRLPVPRSTLSTTAAPLPPIRWEEKRAAKCVPAISLAAAAITRSDSVDLVLNGGKRLRARLDENCPALDFYSGFYVRPASDGMVCASRDSIRSRSGGVCRIRSFKALVPKR